jgi:hypothetical protein
VKAIVLSLITGYLGHRTEPTLDRLFPAGTRTNLLARYGTGFLLAWLAFVLLSWDEIPSDLRLRTYALALCGGVLAGGGVLVGHAEEALRE